MKQFKIIEHGSKASMAKQLTTLTAEGWTLLDFTIVTNWPSKSYAALLTHDGG